VYGAALSVRMEMASVNTTLLALLAFARTRKCLALLAETVPLDVNVAMSAPVSALITVKLSTVWAEAQMGTHNKAPKNSDLQAFEIFILHFLVCK
jgi:hypothetical protein